MHLLNFLAMLSKKAKLKKISRRDALTAAGRRNMQQGMLRRSGLTGGVESHWLLRLRLVICSNQCENEWKPEPVFRPPTVTDIIRSSN